MKIHFLLLYLTWGSFALTEQQIVEETLGENLVSVFKEMARI